MATKKNKEVENLTEKTTIKKAVPKKAAVKKAATAKKATTAKEEIKKTLIKDAEKVEKVVKKVKDKVVEVAKDVEKVVKKTTTTQKDTVNVTFEVRFSTEYGQEIYIVGNHSLLGNSDLNEAKLLNYLNDKAWNISLDFPAQQLPETISYHYFVKNIDGSIVEEGLANKTIDLSAASGKKVYVSDFWSFSGFPVGLFETKPFQVLLKEVDSKTKTVKNATHVFTIKAPIVKENEVVCLLGDDKKLGEWEVKNAIELTPIGNGNWQTEVDLSKATFPIHYKFGLLDKHTKKIISIEAYENRFCAVPAEKEAKVFVNEGLINLQENA